MGRVLDTLLVVNIFSDYISHRLTSAVSAVSGPSARRCGLRGGKNLAELQFRWRSTPSAMEGVLAESSGAVGFPGAAGWAREAATGNEAGRSRDADTGDEA